MVEDDDPKQDAPEPGEHPAPAKEPFPASKIFLYLLALAGVALAGFGGYRGYLRVRAWLSGFGTGAYWIMGLIASFIYYYAAHRIYERIREKPPGSGKAASYLVFCLVLLVVNPLPVSLAFWLYAPSDFLVAAGHWFFLGSAVGAGIVIVLERIFARKPASPKASPKT